MISYFFLLYCTWCAVSVSAVRNGRVGDHGDRVRLPAPVYSALDITKVTPDGLLGDWRLAQSPTLDYRGQHYYFLSSDHDLVSSQMQKGTWENRLNVMFKDLWDNRLPAEKNMIVMDVGVNFGNFYMYAASMGCHMLGFEMQPKLYNIVEMSIRLSGYKHHSNLVNNAVWFSQLEMSFTPVVYGPKQSNLGYTHLLQDGKGDIRINTTRIDAVLANPRISIFFLKMDVEEAEPEALLGMNSIFLAQRVKHLVIELKTPIILEPLYKTGFSCRMFDSSKLCAWPNIDESCIMPTWESMQNYFKAYPSDSIKKKYYDIHCMLGDSVTHADVDAVQKGVVDQLISNGSVKYIRHGNHLFQVVGAADGVSNGIVAVDKASVPAGSEVKGVSYSDLFFLPMVSKK